MSRVARIKSEDSIFHIMIRSITEIPLFKKEEDKDEYMSILCDCQKQYGFKVYAYCLMTNHAHFIIDANGADISKIMHSINFKYAVTFNKKHGRSGHLFQDRFKSKIIDSERYLVSLSAYIHNNPLDIKKYKKSIESYRYSSLGIYLGLRKDPFGVLDETFIMQLFGEKRLISRESYLGFVYGCSDKKVKEHVEFEDEGTLYKSERKILVRNFRVADIVDYVIERTGGYRDEMHIKNRKGNLMVRAFTALLMRHLCNFGCRDICVMLGNITQARVSKLCSIAVDAMNKDEKYRTIITDFIKRFAA